MTEISRRFKLKTRVQNSDKSFYIYLNEYISFKQSYFIQNYCIIGMNDSHNHLIWEISKRMTELRATSTKNLRVSVLALYLTSGSILYSPLRINLRHSSTKGSIILNQTYIGNQILKGKRP